MIAPRYQDVPSARIPVVTTPDGSVRVKVVAGEALGARAVIDTRTPIFYLHFTLQPGARFTQPVPNDHNVFAYVFEGEAAFGPEQRHVATDEMVVLRRDGDAVSFAAAGDRPVELLLVGGVPLGEPIARYGPFVMNTNQEIAQAIEDFQSGRMGAIDR
jgi:quercetin 2,3-dioxygenase